MRPSAPRKIDAKEFDQLLQLRVNVPNKRLPEVPKHSPRPLPEERPQPTSIPASPTRALSAPAAIREEAKTARTPWWGIVILLLLTITASYFLSDYLWQRGIITTWYQRSNVKNLDDKNLIIIRSQMEFGEDRDDFHTASESLSRTDYVVLKPGNLEEFKATLRKHIRRKAELIAHGRGAKAKLNVYFDPRRRVIPGEDYDKAGQRSPSQRLYDGDIIDNEPIEYYYYHTTDDFNKDSYVNSESSEYLQKYIPRLMNIFFQQAEDSDYTFRDILRRLENS